MLRKNLTSKNGTYDSSYFSGFLIDLLGDISENMESRGEPGFSYRIYLAPDGTYGVKDEETGQWSGMIAELLDEVTSS